MARLLALALMVATLAVTGAWFVDPELFQRLTGKSETARRGGWNAGAEAAPVLVSEVAERDVPVLREGIGNVQAHAAITVRAQVEGRLLAIEFREGQEVKKGDILARIDAAIYQAQFDQARAKKAQNEANLANMRLDLERYERLAATAAGSKQQADSQRAQVAQMEAQIRADQAAIDNAKVHLDNTIVRAPIDGRTGLRLVDAGNLVRASDQTGIVSIAQVRPIGVLFTLPQRDFGAVREAMARGAVSVEAMEADGRTAIARGRLEVIDNLIDTQTGTFKLKALFDNEDMKLWPGQFVTARVEIGTLAKARVIPAHALRRGPDGNFVYRIEGDKALVRPVRIALQDEEVAVIAGGLELGDVVVTAGFARLSDGKKIQLPAGFKPPEKREVPVGQGLPSGQRS